MLQLPMFPGWEGIHPSLIHFPLTLFFLAPIFALMAAFAKSCKAAGLSNFYVNAYARWNHIDVRRL